MLILTRRKGETIIINGNIKITLVDILPNRVLRIGIDAPKDIIIDREEIHERRIAEGWDK